MRSTVRFMKDMWHDQCGASAAEYAMILAIVGAALAAAAFILGTAIADQMNQTSTCINTDGVTC